MQTVQINLSGLARRLAHSCRLPTRALHTVTVRHAHVHPGAHNVTTVFPLLQMEVQLFPCQRHTPQ